LEREEKVHGANRRKNCQVSDLQTTHTSMGAPPDLCGVPPVLVYHPRVRSTGAGNRLAVVLAHIPEIEQWGSGVGWRRNDLRARLS
jgi:hypothetical protein